MCPLLAFQSTPPIRVATKGRVPIDANQQISIHATHTGGDEFVGEAGRILRISIHATHTGGDWEVLNGWMDG